MEKMEELKARMTVLAILSDALELLSGDWAKTVCLIAGKKLGEKVEVEEKNSLEEALELVNPWKIELFEKNLRFCP